MKNLLMKEFKLATPVITYLLIGFSLMTFIPGYPILCGAFFACLGIFQGYQMNRDSNDILYSVLLPVSKSDVVKSKYLAAATLQMVMFMFCIVFTFIRMIVFPHAIVYENNVLMAANFIYLAFVLLIFACFNAIFIGGFFKTAYGIGKPFILFIVANFSIIAVAEALHHIPGLEWMNVLDFGFMTEQVMSLVMAVGVYVAVTVISCRVSCLRFEKIDV